MIARLQRDARQAAVHRARSVDFDDTDIAAPRHRVERVVAPHRAQTDHRIGIDRQLVQGRCAATTEVSTLPTAGQIGCGGPLQSDVAVFNQQLAQAVSNRQAGEDSQRCAASRVGRLQRGAEQAGDGQCQSQFA